MEDGSGESWDEEIVGRRHLVVSWDVRRAKRALASWVNGLAYGRAVTVGANGTRKVYRYAGYVDAVGVVRLGQSVLLMPPAIAGEFLGKLAKKAIPCSATELYQRTGAVRR